MITVNHYKQEEWNLTKIATKALQEIEEKRSWQVDVNI